MPGVPNYRLVPALLLAFCAEFVEASPQIYGLRTAAWDDRYRLVLDVSPEAGAYTVRHHDQSDMLSISIASMQVSAQTRKELRDKNLSGSPINGIELSDSSAVDFEINLQLISPIRYKYFRLEADDGGSERLVLDIYPGEVAQSGSGLSERYIEAAGSASVAEDRDLIQGIRLGRDGERTRLVFDLAFAVQYQWEAEAGVLNITWEPLPGELILPGVIDKLNTQRTPLHSIAEVQGATSSMQIIFEPETKVEVFAVGKDDLHPHRLVADFTSGVLPPVARVENEIEPATPSTHVGSVAPHFAPGADTKPRPAQTQSRGERSRSSRPRPGQVSFSAIWNQEWAINTHGEGSQKFESIFDPRLDIRFGGSSRATIIGRLRADGIGDLGPESDQSFNYSDVSAPLYNDANFGVYIRELYFDLSLADTQFRLGKQQVVWGEADGLKVLDVVNPQSFREYILDEFDSSRIPLWMVNAELPIGDAGQLQILWVPDLTYHELAELDTPYFITSPKQVLLPRPSYSDEILKPDKPDDPVSDGDWGLRFTTFLDGWDLSAQYFYHYLDFPVFEVQAIPNGAERIQPVYERSGMFGASFSNTFNAFTLRGELAHNTDVFVTAELASGRASIQSGEFASVLGVDWQLDSDNLLSAQWFISHLLDYERSMLRPKRQDVASVLYQADFSNNLWQFRLLGLYGFDDHDSMIQGSIRYWLRSNLEVWLGADVFSGHTEGIFGQFRQTDRVVLGFEYGL